MIEPNDVPPPDAARVLHDVLAATLRRFSEREGPDASSTREQVEFVERFAASADAHVALLAKLEPREVLASWLRLDAMVDALRVELSLTQDRGSVGLAARVDRAAKRLAEISLAKAWKKGSRS